MFGNCEICGMAIAIPGEDGYLCSSRECGAEIVIMDKKKKKVLSRHPAKGWVKRYDIEKLVKQKKKKTEAESRLENAKKNS